MKPTAEQARMLDECRKRLVIECERAVRDGARRRRHPEEQVGAYPTPGV